MMKDRILRGALGALGAAVVVYGGLRLWQQQRAALPGLAQWLLGSVLVHDVVLAPLVLGIGWMTNRHVPARFRPFLQGGLICAASVLSVAVFLIWRQHKYGAKSLTLLQRNYLLDTAILMLVIAASTVAAYGLSTARTRRTKALPPADH